LPGFEAGLGLVNGCGVNPRPPPLPISFTPHLCNAFMNALPHQPEGIDREFRLKQIGEQFWNQFNPGCG